MSIDKIKIYMNNDELFNYWCNADISTINRAKIILSNEIKLGLLVGVKYDAELNLLNHLSN